MDPLDGLAPPLYAEIADEVGLTPEEVADVDRVRRSSRPIPYGSAGLRAEQALRARD